MSPVDGFSSSGVTLDFKDGQLCFYMVSTFKELGEQFYLPHFFVLLSIRVKIGDMREGRRVYKYNIIKNIKPRQL